MRDLIKRLARSFGYDISRYSPAYHCEARRMSLLKYFDIDILFDVGANTGQYGQSMRELGYTGRIVSFEPLRGVFSKLSDVAKHDGAWDAFNYGLGDFDGDAEIHIAGNTASSSLLDMLPKHSDAAPESTYVGVERISVKKLDSVFASLLNDARHPFMKIDTQGYTKPVIDGASQSMDKIRGIQAEIALTPLYAGEVLLPDMVGMLNERGFQLMSIEPGFAEADTGRLLQVDCIFFRE